VDARSSSWRYLLHPQIRLLPVYIPMGLYPFLSSDIHPDGDTVIKIGKSSLCIDGHAHNDVLRSAVILNPNRSDWDYVRRRGFKFIRTYGVFPNIRDARWYIPLDNPLVTFRAWDIYKPFALKGKVYKWVCRSLSLAKLSKHFGDTLLIAQDEVPILTEIASKYVEIDPAKHFITLSSGTPGPSRKVTACLTDGAGYPIAFVKLGDTGRAIASLQHEFDMMNYVGCRGYESFEIPFVLGYEAGEAFTYIITRPIGNLRPSGYTLLPLHINFLKETYESSAGQHLVDDLVYELASRHDDIRDSLPHEFNAALAESIVYIEDAILHKGIHTQLSHGDFAPWNVYLTPKRLVLLDWESGKISQFPLADAFHFVMQVDLLVKNMSGESSSARSLAEGQRVAKLIGADLSYRQIVGLYMAYLVDVILRWFEDRSGQDSYSLDALQRGRLQALLAASHVYNNARSGITR